jgi:uncharacterized protein YgbK (DUF1537 family)
MIGVIADDVTGATDAAVAFRRNGLRCGIYFGTPASDRIDPDVDATVIALKSRTIPAVQAVALSVESGRALQAAGAAQLYFKYCSSFDSTPKGNIGPVLDALRELTASDLVIGTPSSPEHGRTSYHGYLFVHDLLLSESHMRNHPLTPMVDSSLTRLMDGQTRGRSEMITLETVREGAAAIRDGIQTARGRARYLFPDAITDEDLLAVARELLDEPLVAGAAGLAGALARASVERTGGRPAATSESAPDGDAVVLAGSCSRRTLEQIEHMHRAGRHSYRLDALRYRDPDTLSRHALRWYDTLAEDRAPLIYSSLSPADLHEVQCTLGVERSALILETAMGQIAAGLRDRGVTRFVVAGGETSGSIIDALGIRGGIVGEEAARGVPWVHTEEGIDVLLKSGNFGGPDLLVTASGE